MSMSEDRDAEAAVAGAGGSSADGRDGAGDDGIGIGPPGPVGSSSIAHLGVGDPITTVVGARGRTGQGARLIVELSPCGASSDLGSTADLIASLRLWVTENRFDDDQDPALDSTGQCLVRAFGRWEALCGHGTQLAPSASRARYVKMGDAPYDELRVASDAEAIRRDVPDPAVSTGPSVDPADEDARQVSFSYFRDAWDWVEVYAAAARVEVIPNPPALFSDLWARFGRGPRDASSPIRESLAMLDGIRDGSTRMSRVVDPGHWRASAAIVSSSASSATSTLLPPAIRRVLSESIFILRSVSQPEGTSGLAEAIAGGVAAVDGGHDLDEDHRLEIESFLAQILPVKGSIAASLETLLSTCARLEPLDPCSRRPSFSSGQLDPHRADAFRTHLATCIHCQDRVIEDLQLSARLSCLASPQDLEIRGSGE